MSYTIGCIPKSHKALGFVPWPQNIVYHNQTSSMVIEHAVAHGEACLASEAFRMTFENVPWP